MELTKKQEKAVKKYGDLILKNALKTNVKIDKKFAAKSIAILYKKYMDLPAPRLIYIDSPEAALQAAKEHAPEVQPSDILFLSLWTWWVAYYHAGINILKETEGVEQELIDNLNEYEALTHKLHAILPCEQTCYVISYPVVVSIKDNDLDKFTLHREGGKAIEYPDGTGFSWLNGIAVPDYIACTPIDKLDVKKIMAEANVDIRREGLMRLPLTTILEQIGAKLLDKVRKPRLGKYYDYELYDANFGDGKIRRLLRMYDPGSGGHPIERVDDTCETVEQALAMRDDEESYIIPETRT